VSDLKELKFPDGAKNHRILRKRPCNLRGLIVQVVALQSNEKTNILKKLISMLTLFKLCKSDSIVKERRLSQARFSSSRIGERTRFIASHEKDFIDGNFERYEEVKGPGFPPRYTCRNLIHANKESCEEKFQYAFGQNKANSLCLAGRRCT